MSNDSQLFAALYENIQSLLHEADLIPADRKEILLALARYLASRYEQGEAINLNFICTHNSRRSIISQAWAAAAAAHFGHAEQIHTFSGGTEATAFHPNAVAALERAGFEITKPGGDNPRYELRMSDDRPPLVCYSKVFDDPANPTKDFAAIMTCSDADVNCPFIPGASRRISLTYNDPKVADGTTEEAATYDERVRQIGREILYAFQLFTQHANSQPS